MTSTVQRISEQVAELRQYAQKLTSEIPSDALRLQLEMVIVDFQGAAASEYIAKVQKLVPRVRTVPTVAAYKEKMDLIVAHSFFARA